MKKILILFVLLTSGLSSFCQLRVANNFGKDLYVSVNSKEEFIPSRGVKTFSNVRLRTVGLECRTSDGSAKFYVLKEVSRSGLVEIAASDNSGAVSNNTNVAPVSYNANQTTYTAADNSTGASLQDIIKGGANSTPINYTPASTVVNTTVSTSTVNQSVSTTQTTTVATEAINFIYTGSSSFKIFSVIGRGLEFLGTDSVNSGNTAKNKYTIYVQKNQDLIIGVGIKTGADQAIWPYAEIRKRINSGDVDCTITQKDIKKMSTSENKNLRIRLMAEKYKIFFEPDAGDPVSIGYREVSRGIDVPIGQFYIRVSYTDATGMFHRTVFVPKHVTKSDSYLEITKADLDNSVQLNW